jgi:hypothetical protein
LPVPEVGPYTSRIVARGRRLSAGFALGLCAAGALWFGWRWADVRFNLAAHGLPSRPAVSDGRPMTEWYYADGIVTGDQSGGSTVQREWIVLLNLTSKRAKATATFYFENHPPQQVNRTLPPLSSSYIVSHELGDRLPRGQAYGVRVESTEPVVVQPTRGEYHGEDPVTQAMASFVAYPGPLGARETGWAYADGMVLSSDSPLEEREWISILNPQAGRDANVRVRFLLDGAHGERRILVPAERVRSLDLAQWSGFPKNRLSGVVVESDVPVVVEQIRRAYRRGNPAVVSMWACLAQPIGGQTPR